MKNLYLKKFLLVFFGFYFILVNSQTYVTWNPVVGGFAVNGTAGIVNVFTTQSPGIPISFSSPAAGQANLIVNGAQTFSTLGSTNQGVSSDLIFNFDRPVIITRYNMVDIDLGFSWNDSFIFNGINFSNNPTPFGVNVNVNLNGATATTDVGGNAENASWFCSNPVTTFTLDYQTTGGRTHAYLGYSIEILIPPSINPTNTLCLNSTPPSFPIVGNNIVGNWNPSVINTSTIGEITYTFTPNAGQPIQCPINMTVTVVDCCLPNAILSSPDEDVTNLSPFVFLPNPLAVRHLERSDFINASNIIGVGDNILQNGVIYHAENFVELTPGFEALFGSQFAAYPQGCTGNFTYRNTKPIEKDIFPKEEIFINSNKPSILNLYTENQILKISLINLYTTNITITSIDGKILYQVNSNEKDYYEIDISNYSKGVYIVSTQVGNGQVFSEKFIKN
ncbi:MAG: T9SS type A sorting domain-containing protein [Flavobacterium sp.]|jgi:hypothetical protein|uniref:T9SS type A sorting domain-containing protein n=1 Tax=Flavobacterium sp. TaxID=239 RepID=UPI003BA5F527